MGENEQGGMLRNVVVLGLIALIASVIMALVLSLRNKMVDHVDEATPPTVILNLLEPEDFQIRQHHGNGPRTALPKNACYWDNDGTVLHFNTTTLPNPTWAYALSKRYDIPDGSKRLKFEIKVKGHTSQSITDWITLYDLNNKIISSKDIVSTSDLSDDKYKTFSNTIELPENAKGIIFSLEAREDTVVEYKNATLTYYNH